MKHLTSFKVFEKIYYPLECWDVNDYYHELKTKIEKISPSFLEFLNETYGEEYKLLYERDEIHKFDIYYSEFLDKVSDMFEFKTNETKKKNIDRFNSKFGEILKELRESKNPNVQDSLFYKKLLDRKNEIYSEIENYVLKLIPHKSF